MNTDPVTVGRIQLARAFPMLQLFHAARLAFGLQVMVPSVLAVLISDGVMRTFPSGGPSPPSFAVAADHGVAADQSIRTIFSGILRAVPSPVRQLSRDTGDLLRMGVWHDGHRCWRLVCHILLLSLAGGSVTRSALLSFCRQQRAGAIRSMRRAVMSGRAFLVSAALSVALILLPWVLLVIAGWLVRQTGLYVAAPQLLSAFFWLLALVCTLVAIIVGAGWILSIAAIMADRCTGSDGLSRGINYVLSHRFRAGCCAVLIVLTGACCGQILLVVSESSVGLAESVLHPEDSESQTNAGESGLDQADRTGRVAADLRDITGVMVQALQFGIFFCGVAMAYLLLREAEDAVMLTELNDR